MATTVSLGEHFDAFVAERVQSGRYASASEVIRDGLRQLEHRDRRETAVVSLLREEVRKGLDDPAHVAGKQAFQEIDSIIGE